MRGIVTKATGTNYIVELESGDLLNCNLKGSFRIQSIQSTSPIVVGDYVDVEGIDGSFTITNLYERKNKIVRKSVKLSKKEHIIASNIDQAILMVTIKDPTTTTLFIDRFLVSAEAYSVNVILMFNKLDIYSDIELKKQVNLEKIYKDIGYQTLSYSILNDDLSKVKTILKDKVNILSGHSGVGKSTLINKLENNLNIKTNEISFSHNQGKHTTTFSELHRLSFGGSVIDTPGIKGFGLVNINSNEVCNYFPEFIASSDECKYSNCIHQEEPDCAIKKKYLNGSIAKSRYKNYLSILSESKGNFR